MPLHWSVFSTSAIFDGLENILFHIEVMLAYNMLFFARFV